MVKKCIFKLVEFYLIGWYFKNSFTKIKTSRKLYTCIQNVKQNTIKQNK